MDEWTPPSEEEELRLKKQRDRSNKISKIMGDYLLKGYKMLGTTCNKCQAILLRDRQGEDFCVGCVEVDGSSTFPPDVTQVHNSKPLTTPGLVKFQSPATRDSTSNNNNNITYDKEITNQTLQCLYQQIRWANNCLSFPDINLEQRSHLVQFIKGCYETINTVTKNK